MAPGAMALGLRCFIQLSVFTTTSVFAHSAPGVDAILDEDAAGVHMVRLYQGLVLREGAVWRFVCSQTYGGVGQDLAASVPGGGVAVALPNGIALMQRDGSVHPHPDPEAQAGGITAFARAPGKLYALRMRPRLRVSDVIEITATKVNVVWTDTRFWSGLAVGDSSIWLVRFEQDAIDELQLSFAGEMISEQTAELVDPLEVSVRVIGDVPYYTAKLQTSSLLGRIEQGTWKQLLSAGNNLAGPVALADGTVLVALDGVLSTLVDDKAAPLADTDFVIGLSQLDGHSYACTRTGLRDLTSAGLGTQLFDLSQLLGPDECLVPEAAKNDCDVEWQHLQVELLGASIPLAAGDTAEKVCAGNGAMEAGAGAEPAGLAGAAAMGEPALTAAELAGSAGGSGASGAAPLSTAGDASTAVSSANNAPATGQPPDAPASGCACSMAIQAQHSAASVGWWLPWLACGFRVLKRVRQVRG